MVQMALANLMKDRTTFVIAHRLSTVQRADRIVVLAGGRVVEIGRHDDLLARGGTYQRRSEEHTSELQSRLHLVCRLLLEKKKKQNERNISINTHIKMRYN